MRINGTDHPPPSSPRRLLSDYLRHELGLTGTHVGCEHGVCGCCTVLLDGRAVRSCLLLAVQCEGHQVTTVEGLAGEALPLHRVRRDPARGEAGGRADGETVTTRWFGEPVQRREDERLLRGKGRFTDDLDRGALSAVLVRSPHAYARIVSVAADGARGAPGVVAVYTAADLP